MPVSPGRDGHGQNVADGACATRRKRRAYDRLRREGP